MPPPAVALRHAFPGADSLETPAVVVDRSRLAANLARVPALLPPGVALRPHVKTHKCLEIARLQRAGGASGLTASKSEEAAVFLQAGLGPVTIAYPLVDPTKVARALTAAGEHPLACIADSAEGVAALETAARKAGRGLEVWLKVDVGLHRCGVDPGDPSVPELVQQVLGSRALAFGGLLSHAGQAYGAPDRAGVAAVARQELTLMTELRDRLRARGLPVPGLSVGSTPTVLAAESFEGVTEVRPGNYVFLDLTAVRLGLCDIEDVALAVAATVVSAAKGRAVVDAGSKVLSSDMGAHGTGSGRGYGAAWLLGRDPRGPFAVERLSEEHAVLATPGETLPVGSRMLLFPNHACPVVNLARELLLLSANGPQRWPVDAAGHVH